MQLTITHSKKHSAIHLCWYPVGHWNHSTTNKFRLNCFLQNHCGYYPCSGKTHKFQKDALNAPVQIKMAEDAVHYSGALIL